MIENISANALFKSNQINKADAQFPTKDLEHVLRYERQKRDSLPPKQRIENRLISNNRMH